jgi:hypothetical protein
VYAVTRIADAIQFYLVEWIGAAGFVLWIAVGAAVIATARGRDEARRLGPRRRTILAAALALAVAVGAVAAYPVAAHPTNDGLVSESHRTMLESRAVSRILAVTRGESTVVLRLDHESAWEILATDALLLEQRGKTVRIVESPVTRLLFDEGRLVAGADSQVFAFRERGGSGSGRAPGDSELVASQGRWRVDLIRPR